MNLGGDTGKVFKVGVIVAALIVGLVLLNFIFRVALQLLPLAILVLAAYFGWRWLRNQANNPLAGLMSRLSSQPEDKAQEIRSQRYDEILSQSSRVQDVTFASVTPAEQPASATESAIADDVIQPDLDRLTDKENEAPQITDDVLSQIEARKRRLGQD